MPRLVMIIVTALSALLAGCGVSDPGRIEIKGETFDLTISADDASRARGLGGVAEIPEHGGMIFAFRSAQPQGFWMIDCITDMDILYVDPQGFVVSAYTMVAEAPRAEGESEEAYRNRLRRYPSGKPAQFVIELKAGTIERLGIGPGTKVTLDAKALKELAK
jgi:uncharacterized membrane protein (UPF0127 family)